MGTLNRSICLVCILAILCPIAALGQTSFSGTYSQNFDSLPSSGTGVTWTNNSTLAGWYIFKAGATGTSGARDATTTAVTTIDAGTGSGTGGAIYSYGVAGTNPASDRALGSIIVNANGDTVYGLVLQNASSITYNSVSISYNGEQWRDNGNTAAQVLKFDYTVVSSFSSPSTTLSASNTSGYTALTSLDFTGPIHTGSNAALDGNSAPNRSARSSTGIYISGGWAPNQYLVLRWWDDNDANNDHGLAIDDVSVTAASPVTTVTDAGYGGATVDGVLSANEYGPGNSYAYSGGGTGFGGVLNGSNRLYMNSDQSNLYIGFQPGAALNDYAVVYLRTKTGGFDDSTMSDCSDTGRCVVSNLGSAGNDGFPFQANYALMMSQFGCTFFELNSGTFTVVSSANAGCSGANTNFREASVALSTLGATGGGKNIEFFVAYCSGTNFNSNETIPPMSTINGGGNPGTTSTVNYLLSDVFVTEPACNAASIVSVVPSSSSVCVGGSASFTVTGSGTAPLSYQWRKGVTNLSDGGNISGATSTTLTINPVAAGDSATNYNCVVTNICGSATTADVPLSVQIAPSANAGGPYNTCETAAVNLSGSAANATTVSWSSSGTGSFTNGNTLNASYTPSAADVAAGSVTLTLTANAISPCSTAATSNATLSIQKNPTSNAGGPYSTCETAPVSLSGAATNHSAASWSSSGTGSFTNGNTLNATYTPSAADVAAGSVTLTLTASATSPCTTPATSNATLSIQKNPTASAGSNQMICAGSTATMAGVTSHSGSCTWTTAGDGSFNDASSLNAVYTPGSGDLSAGMVSLTLTCSAIPPCSGSASSSMVLSFQPTPTAYAGVDQSICAGDSVTLAGNTTNSSGCVWTTSGDGSFNDASLLAATYTPGTADLASGTVTLTLACSAVAPCVGNAADSMVVTMINGPTANAGGPYATCGTVPVSLNGSASNQTGVSWASSGTGSFTAGNTLGATYHPSAGDVTAGSVTLTLTANGTSPCPAAVANSTLTLVASPTANAGGPYQSCNTDPVPLNGSVTGAASVSWSTSGDGSFSNGNTVTASYNPGPTDVASGSVTLTLTATGNAPCDSTSSSGTLTILTSPAISIPPSGATIGQGSSFTFSVTASGGALNYQWKKDGNPVGTNSATYHIALADVSDSGSYTVVVSNACGSIESGTAALVVNNQATVTLSAPAGCQTGSQLVVSLNLSSAYSVLVGGQFFLSYNNSVLDFVSADPGDSPFTREIYEYVDETAATIDYAVGIPDGGTGTSADTTMVRLTFNILQNVCSLTPDLVTWRVSGPNDAPNMLSDDAGSQVYVNPVNLAALKIDNTAPSITCPADVTVQCPAMVPPHDFAGGSASDNCSGTPAVVWVGDVIGNQTCANRYTITRTYKATDACGNEATCDQIITVDDTTPPNVTCPADVTVQCPSMVPAHDFVGGSASDNCGGTPTVVWVGDVIGGEACANRYTITRTYKATDACGNEATCDQIITVDDTTPPSITCPANVTVQCASLVPAHDFMGGLASDNCGGTPTVTWISDVISSQTCPNRYTITRTYAAVDSCGNQATCTQTITVDDTTPPNVTCPADVVVSCASLVPEHDFAGGSASDNCGGTPTVIWVGDVVGSQTCANRYTITRTYKATDACGNEATCDQIITVDDTTPPSITCPADVTVQCPSLVPAHDFVGGSASDNCGGTPTVVWVGDVTSEPTCANRYVITRTYLATDDCGNEATCDQIITVDDTTPPSITCPADVTVQCPSLVPAHDFVGGSASDNCGGTPTVTWVGDLIGSQTCANRYMITRTYKATDDCGNEATCDQIITVDDTTPPSITCPADVTVQCGSMVPAHDFAGGSASDNCGGTPTVTWVGDAISNQTCPNRYTITRTYKAADECGNEATCDQIITVNDTTAPSIACPANMSVSADAGSCSAIVNFTLPSATDNCGGSPTVTASPASGSTFPTGTTTVTVTATDSCGNSSQCSFTVTVNPVNELVVTVQLGGGVMAGGPVTRAITFELWNTTVNSSAPLHSFCQPMSFTAGSSGPVTLTVPCQVAGYTCITARDRLHTLRRTLNSLPISGAHYVASFTGGKSLICGNLNDDKFIDILDFGIYTLQDLTPAPGGASTSCGQLPPFRHADLNGDGVVNSVDFSFVANNFLQIRDATCNGNPNAILAGDDSPGGNYGAAPITSISVSELRRRGMSNLAKADLNNDRVLDQTDVILFLQGVRPTNVGAGSQ